MFKAFKAKKTLFFSLILLLVFSLPIAAKTSDWKNPAYHFEQVKTILVKTPVFSYDYPERDAIPGKNYFERYPRSESVINSILSKQTGRLLKYNFIREAAENIVTPAKSAEPLPTTISAEVYSTTGMEPLGDLVLSIKIIDFGWYYEHYEGYWAHESLPQEETIYERDSSGKLREVGKRKSTITIPVYHPPGYKIRDFAGAEFIFNDAKTGEEVWKYTDYRDRDSNKNSWEKDGPESMMNRVFSAAFDKMPLTKK